MPGLEFGDVSKEVIELRLPKPAFGEVSKEVIELRLAKPGFGDGGSCPSCIGARGADSSVMPAEVHTRARATKRKETHEYLAHDEE